MGLLSGAGFAGGLLHPLLAPAHVLALVGVGLIAARNAVPVGAAFASGLAGGLAAIAWGVGETPANDVLLAASALCGLAAALGCRLPAWLAAPIAVAAGLALGLDSPPQTISLHEAVLMLIGTACGSILVLGAVATAAAALCRLWHGIALRIAGSWVAAIAILVLASRWASAG